MRLIGNKTHGDLAEIAISEFINQYMYDFSSTHVGKDLFRSKSQEEDIEVLNEITKKKFPISLKAYGVGPLQLSTDKDSRMFPMLEQEGVEVIGRDRAQTILRAPAFAEFNDTNVLPLIYDENPKRCNILVFDYERAATEVNHIERVPGGIGRRKYPVYQFHNSVGDYICEVRYGDASANALQRGLWTHTRKGLKYFESVTGGWIDYSHNLVLVRLFSQSLISSKRGHQAALAKIQEDIDLLEPLPWN
ncbi:MAG: hypothetical protein F4X14_17205 [Caldilineaceae bacterium SB0661_bin_32]|uniref:Uncharacterized protein n=1 Tax=Caldilineaceae bacterium SB0661_bin_32 TaxID=2605255 RepID=A0A6B1DCE0_9CHLR|nr:hypothetical protein [Caldilineaceae bacterium SB0661_bin_32]